MKELDNLVKINKLKPEPPDAQEFAGMVRAAETKLKDAAISGLAGKLRIPRHKLMSRKFNSN
ncbi:hypothetical protein [Endozoicomonas sp. GU-1]|uniref:hypothetical protein n=1 Tax=Endozoicomonas sp. GU-1 TaxID=3009078 RepID=UPI0022B3AFA7|nr:hypothetical protein [Endozoicomonas sp. GU-1]WBA81456.1 hypothetical protein O2T12_24795 [Endozoicomonas sp. GU-1]WBA84403.1 hypothetical protein O3276_13955 [Endozoicomonas sp. GU-1]